MLYAMVNGVKQRASKGIEGVCPGCATAVRPQCGKIKIHHWRHVSLKECDSWFESLGPWHLSWQDLVQPDFVEVVRGPHRADIQNLNGTVVELQHSPISPEQIAEREDFYGDMVWMFDATSRFPAVPSGDRAFFSFLRTKHLKYCQKQMFLDCGDYIIEVESFTSDMDKFSGFGKIRDRRWFAATFLLGCLKPAIDIPHDPPSTYAGRWPQKQPWRLTEHPSRWHNPDSNTEFIIKKKAIYIPLNYDWVNKKTRQRRPAWSKLIEHHPQLANGWTDDSVNEIKELLHATPMVLQGRLRLMPGAADKIRGRFTVARTNALVDTLPEHIQASRVPILQSKTLDHLIALAKEYERVKYGRELSMTANKQAAQQGNLF